ncbi:MAG TPA: hypothetical protein VNB03_14370 [Casimicrobiaceae bacterium]|nr:hypothetical protein [Casimicrobiaceae bacterium]
MPRARTGFLLHRADHRSLEYYGPAIALIELVQAAARRKLV